MRFNVASKPLLNQLTAVSKIINSKNALSILDNFLLTLNGNTLTITGSDQENIMTANIEVMEAEGGGKVAINAKRLVDMLKEVSGQALSFEINDENFAIDIRFLNGHYNFMGVNGNEYPQLDTPQGEAKVFNLPCEVVQKGIENTLFAAHTEIIRPVMTGVYWDICPQDTTEKAAQGVTFVATDTHKLVRYINTKVNPGLTTSFIMPPKPASILRSILSKDDENVEISIYEKNATFKWADYMISCRFINGRYPAYNKVIPQSNPFELNIDRVSLLNALRRVSLSASQASFLVKLTLNNDSITLESQDVDYSTSAQEHLTCSYQGNAMVIGFNATYLIEVLSNLHSDNISMKLSDPARPGIFTPVPQGDDEDVIMLLMPMQVDY